LQKIICVENVAAGYGRGTVLDGIDIAMDEGEVLGVVGRNGMGKTTLTRVIAGLLPIRSGQVTFDGHVISKLPPHRRSRRGIAVVPQGRGVFPELTVRQNIQLGQMAATGTPRPVDEIFDYFPRLGERMDQRAGTMSGGEQQMLAIARALMGQPRLLVLDEPSDGISPLLVQQISRNIVDINRNEGLSILIVEQNVPMMREVTTRCVVVEGGAVVADGAFDRLEIDGVIDKYIGV
jgi:ABC-type branched-subunit amino acid transport system ATPase component